MYSNEQSRINAVICYFFLGPFILFAKKDTPLGDTYVRAHAKESSKIVGIMVVVYILYFFVRNYINIGIPGLGMGISTLVLAWIVWVTIFYLSRWAYYAYLWNIPWETNVSPIKQFSNIAVTWVYTVQSEEEKSRILASMIPFLGIWITKKYNLPIMIRGRVLWSLFAFIYIISLLFSSEVWLIPTIVIILWIVLIVVEGIYLFLYNSFVSWNILDKIPTYNEVESHIRATSISIVEFFKVSFGKEKTGTYSDHFQNYMDEMNEHESHPDSYFMPAWLIGIPFWNIFSIPSLFIKKYNSYRFIVMEWLLITLLFSYFIFWRKEFASPYLLLLLFPITHILVYARSEKNIHTPGIWLITRIFTFAKNTHMELKESAENNKESFTYDTSKTESSNNEQ